MIALPHLLGLFFAAGVIAALFAFALYWMNK